MSDDDVRISLLTLDELRMRALMLDALARLLFGTIDSRTEPIVLTSDEWQLLGLALEAKLALTGRKPAPPAAQPPTVREWREVIEAAVQAKRLIEGHGRERQGRPAGTRRRRGGGARGR